MDFCVKYMYQLTHNGKECGVRISNSLRHASLCKFHGIASAEPRALLWLVDWLYWVERPFETVLQSISSRLPDRERERDSNDR